jgi:2-oxoglutarate dehydrogenase E2 component (dihydrolipoamide succinyltransferase)
MSNIVVPQLGESVVEARIARWLKKEGDRVETGEPVVELETEKIDVEVGADHAGVISSIKRQEGDDVKVGELLAVVDEAAAGTAPPRAAGAAPPRATAAAPPPATAGNGSASKGEPPADAPRATPADGPRATPTARRIARDHDVDLKEVPGSGSAGRVTKRDVQSAVAPAAPTSDSSIAPTTVRGIAPTSAKPIAPTSEGSIAPTSAKPIAPTTVREIAPTSESTIAPTRDSAIAPTTVSGIAPSERSEERVRMSKRRQTIARRLVEAQHTAAILTTFNDVDMTAVMALRERRKEAFKKEYGVGLGIASFFVKAAIAALKVFPQLNAEVQGDEIVLKHYYDIGIAVGAEGGLVVPVLRDADRMSFPQIELAIRDFAHRATDGKLTLEDLMGGTFTITNGGVFGSLLSTPILNPPQVGILGLHKIQDRVVPVNGQVVIRPMMYVALSYDHRIVDGREAVQFLAKVKEFVEEPANLLLVN